ncbi:MAG: alpha-amylase [Anaerolineales bacterium]|nr:alpha-amylase [Anaerolineales bacterium]
MSRPTAGYLEFHVSRSARDLYQFDQGLFSFNGNIIFANFHAARQFAQKMNARRDLVSFPEQAVRAGQINAMGLIDEILHLVVEHYREQRNQTAMEKALAWLNDQVGSLQVENALRQFAEQFPPVAVYRREISLDEYVKGESIRADGSQVPNRQVILEELLLLWLANANPAFSPFLELFADDDLKKHTAYSLIITSLHDFFDTQPTFGPDNQNLIDMLRSPAIANPHSLTGQLEYIRNRWGAFLGRYLYRLLSSLDLIKEEEKPIFGVGGQGPAEVYDFTGLGYEPERFSQDREWMPNLVLLAKNTYVWLHQMSKQYKRQITHLDQIPDEELDKLARWGFTGLWLIGLWERSPASKRIKQMRGNPDAVASAYSLYSYDIAADLGGEQAYIALRDRAWKRGIRLASDMVPNHMGIDSRWVVEHPDWFIQLNYSPFPSYSFNGPNLSWDDRVGLYLEDHYYDNSDAAVVFRRVDFWSGESRYVYHGNDGTSMPWNDTAQLNYLLPEVREAVIQTILHVARKFPIIRFDAAMTLAKRHYQRLWFPEPGSGGDIPSRADHGMTKAQFDQAIPEEFWREVVDRVAQEAPDTLLLAEAFWLMEGYFVRTLGMHRVYNSAFMNMLRDEKNQEYRLVIKNTIEFDPQILKRYVNFMNNPDERTTVDQFGRGDKYFGICAMLATLPGLPMFGHGQVEGFAEKYGMEFYRPLWDETADSFLVERHEREIFPLLRRRYLFGEAYNFLLYDFYTPEGYVNEDVYAYSNQAGEEHGLVLYHNKYATARGWVRISAATPVKTGEERSLVQKTLGEGLGLHNDQAYFVIFRDHVSGLEYIRNSQEMYEKGFYVELNAYKYHVFLDFREMLDDEWHRYAQLCSYLDGRGVPNIDEALKEIFLQPIHLPFRELFNAGMLRWLLDHRAAKVEETLFGTSLPQALDEAEWKARAFLAEVKRLAAADGDPEALAVETRQLLKTTLSLPALAQDVATPEEARAYLLSGADNQTPLEQGDPATWGTLFAWAFTARIGKILEAEEYADQGRAWLDEWLLGKLIAGSLQDFGLSEEAAWRAVGLARLLISHQDWYDAEQTAEEQASRALETWLKDRDVQRYLMINRYQGVLWFNKEAFSSLLWWFFVAAVITTTSSKLPGKNKKSQVSHIANIYALIRLLKQAEEESGYQIDALLDAVKNLAQEE